MPGNVLLAYFIQALESKSLVRQAKGPLHGLVTRRNCVIVWLV